MKLAKRIWRSLGQLCTRVALTVRYRVALGYSWHLAWVKAERA